MFVNTAIRNAGYYIPYDSTTATTNTASGEFGAYTSIYFPQPSFAVGQTLTGSGIGATTMPSGTTTSINNTCYSTATGSSSDTFSVRFVADTSTGKVLQGCSSSLTDKHVYTDSFALMTVQHVSGFALACTEIDNGLPPGTTSASPNYYILIGGLAGMNVLYGVDTANSGSVTQYMTATSVTNNAYWSRVKTVYVTLQFNNPFSSNGLTAAGHPVCITQAIPYTAALYTRTVVP